MIENLSPKKKLQKKKLGQIPYSKFFIFVILLILLLVAGYFVERNVKNQKVLGIETKKKELKPLGSDIKEKTARFANDIRKDAEKILDNVLGEVTKVVANTASSSAEAVTDFVFQNTVGNLVKQIDKLPNRQKEEIKKEICR